MSCSSTSEFIATTHANELGISIWADKSFYQTVYCNAVPTKPIKMNAPEQVVEADDDAAAMAKTLALTVAAQSESAAAKVSGRSKRARKKLTERRRERRAPQ